MAAQDLRDRAEQYQQTLIELRQSPLFDARTGVVVAAVTAAVSRDVLLALADLDLTDGPQTTRAVESVLQRVADRNRSLREQAIPNDRSNTAEAGP